MEMAHASHRGAFGLELEGGGKEMIDAPMLKQVNPFGSAIALPLTGSSHVGRENHPNCESGWYRDTGYCLK